jgi:hypothetical protein
METKKLHARFECKKCSYESNKKSSYDKHILSKKHMNDQVEVKTTTFHNCKKCGKEYKTQSGLWKHTRTCNVSLDKMQKLIESNKELTRIVLQQQQILGDLLITST